MRHIYTLEIFTETGELIQEPEKLHPEVLAFLDYKLISEIRKLRDNQAAFVLPMIIDRMLEVENGLIIQDKLNVFHDVVINVPDDDEQIVKHFFKFKISEMPQNGGQYKYSYKSRMNRVMRRNMKRRCSYRKNGGGYSVGAPLIEQPSGLNSDWTFAVKAPLHSGYSDCTFAERPGQLYNQANPELAQTVMAGGACPCSMRGGKRGGPSPCLARYSGGTRKHRYVGGGSYGYTIDPSVSVGGNGPVAAPLHTAVPCDSRAGVQNLVQNPDPRAPSDLYSLTPNQTGGAATLGDAFDDSCYRAPGSSIPVYNASSAGFHFQPSTEIGSTLPDGVTTYMDVVPHAARMGGSRRRRRQNRKSRKMRK
jgi:hypothetical protein